MIQCIQFDIASLRRHELGVSWYFVVFFTYYRKEKFNVGFFNDMHIDIASLTGSPLVTILIGSLLVTMSMVMAVVTTCKTREIIFN